MEHLAAIDQGTTSSRCIVFDAADGVVASAQREHRQIFPRPGWVEHDAEENWRAAGEWQPAADVEDGLAQRRKAVDRTLGWVSGS